MPKFRRGPAAIAEAAESSNSNSKFRSFAPTIKWGKDNMEKFVLILTPIDEVISVDLHSWIPVGEVKRNGKRSYRYEDFISRKDPAIGEDTDDLEDRLDRSPSRKIFGVGVELEPTYKTVKGRKRATGFEATTRTYTRKTKDGEEEVEVSNIGLIVQSSKLMWTPLSSIDASQGPLEDLPLEIKREGLSASDTDYTIMPYPDAPVNLEAVLDTLDGLSYLEGKREEILAEIDSLDEDAEDFDLQAAQVIARVLLDTRLEELCDEERYEELVGGIKWLPEPFKTGAGDPQFFNKSSKAEDDDDDGVEEEKPRKKRASRKPQRKKSEPEDPEEEDDDDDVEEEPEEKPERRKKASEEPEEEEDDEAEEEKPAKKTSDKKRRFEAIKKRMEEEQG